MEEIQINNLTEQSEISQEKTNSPLEQESKNFSQNQEQKESYDQAIKEYQTVIEEHKEKIAEIPVDENGAVMHPEDAENLAISSKIIRNLEEKVQSLNEHKEHTSEESSDDLDDLDALLEDTIQNIQVESTAQEVSELTQESVEEAVDVDLSEIDDLINETLEREIEEPQLTFEVSEESGLSLQKEEIDQLNEYLEGLTSRTNQEITEKISRERQESLQVLIDGLDSTTGIQSTLYTKVSAAIEQSNLDLSVEDFIAKNSQLQEKSDAINLKIQDLESKIEAFQTETDGLIQDAYQKEIESVQTSLQQRESEYQGSEAELYDKKIILDQSLDSRLLSPKDLFDTDTIDQILELYGLEEGPKKIESLKLQSEVKRDEVRKEELHVKAFESLIYFQTNEQLADALSADLEPKLAALYEQDSESKTLRKALKLQGKDRIEYLVESDDPQFAELTSWYVMNRNSGDDIDTILSNFPELASYIDTKVESQLQKEKSDEWRMNQSNELQQEVDQRIERSIKAYKNEKIQQIQNEMSPIKKDQDFIDENARDERILREKESLNWNTIEKFKQELSVEDSIQLSPEGEFYDSNNLIATSAEISKQMTDIMSQTSEALSSFGLRIKSPEDFTTAYETVQADLDKEMKKLFKNKKLIAELESVKELVESNNQQYLELSSERKGIQQKRGEIQSHISELNQLYASLPQFIQGELKKSAQREGGDLATSLDQSIDDLQQYQTSPKLVAQRENLARLQQEIDRLQGSVV